MGQTEPKQENKNDVDPNIQIKVYGENNSSPIRQIMQESRYQSSSKIADSIVRFSIHQKKDSNLTKTVQSRLNNLPIIVANAGSSQNQKYDHLLKAKFVGELVNDKPTGFGKLYFDNGDYLEGTFFEGRCQGQGRIIKSDGSYYEGQIKSNQADGHGRYYDISGYKYEGQWKNNMPNGTGQVNYTNNSRYIGEFLNGRKHGKGMHMENGCIFEGDFVNGKIQGQCTYEGNNGQKYTGQWKDSLKQGKGIYEWPNEKKYEGQYKNDKRHGYGIMSYYGGAQKYSGQWKNGLKHGKGIYQSPTQKMNGEWVDGKLIKIIK